MAYQFELVDGTEAQVKILYKLLENRIHVISHSEMPQYEAHKTFVKCHPYRKWYLIKLHEDYFGSFYVKNDNSIGLNLSKIDKDIVMSCIYFIQNSLRPREAIASMVPDYFFINVATSNEKLIKVLQSIDTPKIQTSFKI